MSRVLDLANEAHIAELMTKALGVSSVRPVVAQVELGFIGALMVARRSCHQYLMRPRARYSVNVRTIASFIPTDFILTLTRQW